MNPTCSAELWNTLGDGLYTWGRIAESKSAYYKALAINPTDVRGRFNLAFVHIQEKNYPAALGRIAEAFGYDKMGEYRDRLLQKQQEALMRLAGRHQQEYLTLINLVSRYAKKEDSRQTTDESKPATHPDLPKPQAEERPSTGFMDLNR